MAFYSQAFNDTQQCWSTIEQETFGIAAAIRHWDHFVDGKCFIVETDHRNHMYIHKCSVATVVRWRIQSQDYDFIITLITGTSNVVADYLLRFPPALSAEEQPGIKMMTPIVDALDAPETAVTADNTYAPAAQPALHLEGRTFPLIFQESVETSTGSGDPDFGSYRQHAYC